MTVRDGDYTEETTEGTVFKSLAKSQQLGNHDAAYQRYDNTVDRFGNNESSVVGYPNVGKGLDCACRPKAWVGADAIYAMTSDLTAKVGAGTLTNTGTTLADLATDVFNQNDYGPFYKTDSYNYVLNKGDVDEGVGDVPNIGECRFVSATGQHLRADQNDYSTSVDVDYERSIRYVPSTITPASEVFILSRGYGGSANCEYAISYDSTSIYRTIGGSKVAVGLTATYLTVGDEALFSLYNIGSLGEDSFGINDQIVRDRQTSDRGSVTSTLFEVVGGINATDSNASASTINALGHYRLFRQYNEDRVLNPEILDNLQQSSFQNYSCSMVVWFNGDSNVNGFGGPKEANNRGLSIPFVLESELIKSGLDVIVLNMGVGGTTYENIGPYGMMASTLFGVGGVEYGSISFSVTKGVRELQCDIAVSRSGSNDYNNQTETALPYNWAKQLHTCALMSLECARYNVPFVYNTTGNNTATNAYYELDAKEDAALGMLVRSSGNCVDTHTIVRDPITLYGYDWAFLDDVHYTIRGARLVGKQFFPSIFKYLHTSKFIYPETAI